MKFPAQRIWERMEFLEPAANVVHPHSGVASALLVPVDRCDWVHGRKIRIAFPRMVIDRSEATHRTVGDVRPVLLGDLVMPFEHEMPQLTSEIKGREMESGLLRLVVTLM